tara:strand:+ start:5036 stop:6088 length:1053 start_codon:yes stop_codon:yes gene_type:complete
MKELLNLINTIKKKNVKKKVCFFLGNTKKLENRKFFFTPIRENENFIIFGAIVYSDQIAKKILKVIDGKIDMILVDIEKKIQAKNKTNGIVNIERSAKDVVKKSKLYIYKANDLAVSAAETLLSNLFLKDKRGLGGKKILIIGVGNIGFKLALKFVESGSKIFICSKKGNFLKNFSTVINKIKPMATVSKVKSLPYMPKDFRSFDIIISSANKKNIIKKNNVKNVNKKTIFIDVGKGNFDKSAITTLSKKNTHIYRLDTTSSYFSYLEGIGFVEKNYDYQNVKKKINNFTFILRGIVGQENDIIVDNVKKPKKIFGICDGEGGFKDYNYIEKKNIIKKIRLITKINLSYD